MSATANALRKEILKRLYVQQKLLSWGFQAAATQVKNPQTPFHIVEGYLMIIKREAEKRNDIDVLHEIHQIDYVC